MNVKSVFVFLAIYSIISVFASPLVTWKRDVGTRIYDDEGYHWNDPIGYAFWGRIVTIINLSSMFSMLGCMIIGSILLKEINGAIKGEKA